MRLQRAINQLLLLFFLLHHLFSPLTTSMSSLRIFISLTILNLPCFLYLTLTVGDEIKRHCSEVIVFFTTAQRNSSRPLMFSNWVVVKTSRWQKHPAVFLTSHILLCPVLVHATVTPLVSSHLQPQSILARGDWLQISGTEKRNVAIFHWAVAWCHLMLQCMHIQVLGNSPMQQTD